MESNPALAGDLWAVTDPSSLSTTDVVSVLDTDPGRGLTAAVAAQRLEEHGPNELTPAPPVPRWRRFLAQLQDPVVYLLGAAIAVSLLAWWAEGADEPPFDAIVIAAIVAANAVIGYVQEHRADQAVAALRDLTRTDATVIRDGERRRLWAADLVPGDVIVLGEGDIVPADVRWLEVAGTRVAEAALTGESAPVTKSTDPVDAGTALGDRTSMAYSGTAVVSGRGLAAVTATGARTEVGKIATLLEQTEEAETPLRREIRAIGRLLGAAVVIIAVAVVATLVVVDGLRTGSELTSALLVGVSLAVAAVPEGLPAVLSLVLALGVQRMAGRNALVKELPSVETLGSSTVICSDKTGTLTRNEMMVRRLIVPSGTVDLSGSGYQLDGAVTSEGRPLGPGPVLDEVRWALIGGTLASDASLQDHDGRIEPIGDPTEAAIVVASSKAGIEPERIEHRFARRTEIPFSSERKRMSTISEDSCNGNHLVMATKGAPEILLPRCRSEQRDSRIVELDGQRRRWWLETIEGLADDALRTIAIAYRPVADAELDEPVDGSAEDELILLGVVGMIDPPRDEARQAVETAHRAGIRVVMITGDHPRTALRIATELGIVPGGARVATGPELETSSDAELVQMVTDTSVFARVAPEHKLRIVHALHATGNVVAMTGDGVNDAPALKAANIGIAMGVTGTDVSKEAAHMILTDDNFATIVDAISEGRAIFHNIRSFLRYLLSSNAGEVLTVFVGVAAAAALGLAASSGAEIAAPLLAAQILWINLVTDAGPALALGVDPPTEGLMARRPRRIGDRVIDRRMQGGIVLIGATMAVATLTMLDLRLPGGLLAGSSDLPTARTGAFTVLVLAQLFNAFNARSETESIWGRLGTNRWLLGAVGLSLALQVVVVHVGFMNEAFGTVPLPLTDWLVAAGLASSVVWVSEIRKIVLRRRAPLDELD